MSGVMSLTPEKQDGLFHAIRHGDKAHQRWLREAIRAYYAGEPIPPVVPASQTPEPAPILSHLDEARQHYESSYRQMLDAKEALEKARGWDCAHPSRE